MKLENSSKYPAIVLWVLIPIIFFTGLWMNRINEAEVNIEAEYMAFPVMGILTLMCIYLLFAGLLYWILRFQKLIKWMTQLHLIITWASFLYATFLTTAPQFHSEGLSLTYLSSRSDGSIVLLSLILLLFVGTQLIFGYNIGLGLINRKKSNY